MTDNDEDRARTLQNFDLYQQKVFDILQENSTLQSQQVKLNSDIADLTHTKNLLETTLSEREADLDNLSNNLMKNMNESVELLKHLQQDVADKKKMSETQYELDICLSCKRSLERDCMLQKNENQRLMCLNSQLTQEVKTLKHNSNRNRPYAK